MAFIRSGGFRVTLLVLALLGLAAGAGGFWFYKSFLGDLPDLRSIEDFRPPVASTVLDRNGQPIGEFFNQRRYIAPTSTIPQHTRLAFVAAEDQNFFEHAGIDYRAILRAAWVDVLAGGIKEGASTITMQLVKQMLLNPERKFRRKIREMVLATQIEERFSKDEILYLYLNQIYFGHGAWGIGAAAKAYFDKDVSELSVSESAMLAGLPQRPSEYSPYRDPVAAERRRKSVIRRMQDMGVVDKAGAAEAMADIPVLAPEEANPDYVAALHFTEEVRRYLYERLGGDVVLENGLVIETTLDLKQQRAATLAVEAGLIAHDHRYGYRGHVRQVAAADIEAEIQKLAEENDLVAAPSELEDQAEDEAEAGTNDVQEVAGPALPADEPVLGVVTWVSDKAEMARVAFSPEITAEVHLADVDWARMPHPKQRPRPLSKLSKLFSTGDVARFILLEEGASKAPYPEAPKKTAKGEDDETKPVLRVALHQVPEVEGALFSLETATGDVLAMVGGRDYLHSEFNRATQAMRQPGSSFKPFIYGAALSRGYTPVSILYDRPIVIEDRDSGFVWRPRNYSRHFFGPIPMRRSLAKSVNNATVHLFRDVGVDYVIDYARRLGIHSPLNRDLTLALGSSDVTLQELTTAYAIFPNGGRRVVPRFIKKVTDRDGQVLLEDIALGDPPPPVLKPLADPRRGDDELEDEEEAYPDSQILATDRIISRGEAFLMCDLLKAVVQEGTGRGVKHLPGYLGGKTGTTNDQADAWFIGFSPDVTTGVWVGYDSVKLLGWGETGGKTALPIWRDYMKVAIEGRPLRDFDAPDEIVYERVDPETGLLADASTKNAYFQPFLGDSAPTELSSQRTSVTNTRRSLREDAFQ